MSNLVGSFLKNYRIIEVIGKGGNAVVFKAYDLDNQETVAIKVLREGFSTSRFRREVRALARLKHPHILPVYDFDLTSGLAYLVMPYVEKGTLRDLMRERHLSLREIVQLFSKVAQALDYAHQNGILHRDIKPGNILMDEMGSPVLADFGIAKEEKIDESMTQWASSTGTHQALGTPTYLAPEQARGKATKRSDIYSLGVMLYEMMVGEVPYRAASPWELINMHVNAPIPRPRDKRGDLPEAIEDVIIKALAKNPHHRFESAQEMADALEDAFFHQRRLKPDTLPEEGTTSVLRTPITSDTTTPHWSWEQITPLVPDSHLVEDDIRWDGISLAAWLLYDSWSLDDDTIEELYGSRLRPPLAKMVSKGMLTPSRRAQMGRYLSRLYDDRKGVSFVRKNGTIQPLPDMDWVRIPGSDELSTFHISRYPVTHLQYRAFLLASDGYPNQDWWVGLQRASTPERERASMYWNHPHTQINWYDAIAFCRWLSVKMLKNPDLLPRGTRLPKFNIHDPLTWAVRLPTGSEWERAARGSDGRRFPWGNEYISEFANINEPLNDDGPNSLGCTTPVGMYPRGASPYGVLDMSGNVWEWCLNEFRSPDRIRLDGSEHRELRGGSWSDPSYCASCVFREKANPNHRSNVVGLRLGLFTGLTNY